MRVPPAAAAAVVAADTLVVYTRVKTLWKWSRFRKLGAHLWPLFGKKERNDRVVGGLKTENKKKQNHQTACTTVVSADWLRNGENV